MVLSYLTYATGVFHVALATGSPFVALTLFFLVHVSLLWPLYGLGASTSVDEFEYFSLYPLVACAAALLAHVLVARTRARARIVWFEQGSSPECCAQRRVVVWHLVYTALLVVGPALVLELYVSNAFVGGLVSWVSAIFVHVLAWHYYKTCAAPCEPVAHRTFALWSALLDVFVLRLAYTIAYAVWDEFLFTSWPVYVMLASCALGFVALLVLECCFLRSRRCTVVARCEPARCEAAQRCDPVVAAPNPCYEPQPLYAFTPGAEEASRGRGIMLFVGSEAGAGAKTGATIKL